MSETENLEIKDFEYYLVFTDDNDNYIMAYGYERKPAILEMKYAIETLTNDPDLSAAIPDFKKVIDYICFDVMTHKKFIKYMVKQEEKMKKYDDKKTRKKK